MDPVPSRRQAALEFIRRFCTGDVNGIYDLLAEDFQFTGPLLQCGSRKAYLESLRTAPPEPTPFRILSLIADAEQVAIFYEYLKADHPITIAQLFRFAGSKIGEIMVVFDARSFVGD